MVYQNKKPSLISLFYFIAFFVFLSCVLAILSSSQSYIEDTWQNYAEYNFKQEVVINEDGEEVVYNLISTPEQLAGAFDSSIKEGKTTIIQSPDIIHNPVMPNIPYEQLKDYTDVAKKNGVYYKLTSDIDLSGKKWASKDLEQGIIFDGNSFLISNLNNSQRNEQIIGFVAKNYGEIKDLVFKNANICNYSNNGEESSNGVVCGENHGIITNCIVMSGEVKGNYYDGNNDRRVGGICGYNLGTIYRCANYAKVNQGKFLGGICGVMGYNASIQMCFNYGEICDPFENFYPRLGGICGESYGTINLCLNFGKVSDYFEAFEDDLSAYVDDTRVGGIVGYTNGIVSECGNNGQIQGGGYTKIIEVDYGWYEGVSVYANSSEVGGIVGCASSQSVINDCYNMGDVHALANQTYNYNDITVDKITQIKCSEVSYSSSSATKQVKNYYEGYCNLGPRIEDAEKIDGKYKIGYYKYKYHKAYGGGIVGYGNYCSVTNCYNTGKVSGGTEGYEFSISYTIAEDYATSSKAVLSGWNYLHKVEVRTYTYEGSFDCKYNYHGIVGRRNSNTPCYDGGSTFTLYDCPEKSGYKIGWSNLYVKKYTYTNREGFNLFTPLLSIILNVYEEYGTNHATEDTYMLNYECSSDSRTISAFDDSNMKGFSNMKFKFWYDDSKSMFRTIFENNYIGYRSNNWNFDGNYGNIGGDGNGDYPRVIMYVDQISYKGKLSKDEIKTKMTSLSDKWSTVDSLRNSGYPYLKNMYW